MRSPICLVSIVGLLLTTATPAPASVVYNAAADFSLAANPNGVWSYGYSTTLGGTFLLGTNSGTQSGIDWWINDYAVGNPSVTHNPSAGPVTFGTVTWPGLALGFHPGPQGEFAIVRFTAPTAGDYGLASSFAGLDFVGPTTTDVHVLVNGTPIFNGVVNGYGSGSGPSFNTALVLAAGDQVDFVVGVGSNGNYFYDTTQLDAVLTLQAVPEPATLAVFGILATGAFGIRRRKHART